MRDYLPRNQGELLMWANAFASRLAATPQDYGLSNQMAQEVVAAAEAYAQAHSLASNRSTRTQAIVHTKNKARQMMEKLVRPVVQQIRANPAVADKLKIDIGIRLPGRSPAAVAEATLGRPQLHISAVLPRRHVLGYTRVEGPGKAKPFGAIGLQLFMHVGDSDSAPEDPADARFLRFLSRSPYAVDFKSEQVGKTAFYFARWQTATGDTGPWSHVLKMTVAG